MESNVEARNVMGRHDKAMGANLDWNIQKDFKERFEGTTKVSQIVDYM
jgi:hypothetical protein